MSNVLVRGLPEKVRIRIQKMADGENLSVNQMLIQLIVTAINISEKQKRRDEREQEAFRRLDEFREEMYRKYGMFDDSAKLIREDRDSR
jgi:hypothetical protein